MAGRVVCLRQDYLLELEKTQSNKALPVRDGVFTDWKGRRSGCT